MSEVITTATLVGPGSVPVYIESDMSRSLPGTIVVGLGDKAISEAKERIRSAIKNSKLENPKKRITINLSPADLPKDGSHFDLGMALSILLQSGQIPENCLKNTMVLGELSLDGSIRPINGTIGHLVCAKQAGLKRVILPSSNLAEARLVDGLELLTPSNLRQLVEHLNGVSKIPKPHFEPHALTKPRSGVDMSDVVGQAQAKRALEVAAAGGHNLMMSGPPGGGKTMLARALPSILPGLTKPQIVEATHIHNLGGAPQSQVVTSPPFRSPHHSASHVSLVGGGNKPSPGEISLAHNGVLFLDEIPEFSRQSLEVLRQPLEDNHVTVSRASGTVRFPASVMLVATKNPCPCGYFGSTNKVCDCSQAQIDRYQNKLSGPLLDRIDLFVAVEPTEHARLLDTIHKSQPSQQIKQRVEAARAKQMKRQGQPNAQLSSTEVKHGSWLDEESKQLLDVAAAKLHLSSRSYIKTIKVARTIADLDESNGVNRQHIAEAVQFREN